MGGGAGRGGVCAEAGAVSATNSAVSPSRGFDKLENKTGLKLLPTRSMSRSQSAIASVVFVRCDAFDVSALSVHPCPLRRAL